MRLLKNIFESYNEKLYFLIYYLSLFYTISETKRIAFCNVSQKLFFRFLLSTYVLFVTASMPRSEFHFQRLLRMF